MFNVIVYIIIFLSCSLCGFLISMKYNLRVDCLNDLTESLRLLNNEIMYRRDPLPETFERISAYKSNSSSAFFLRLTEILRENKTFLFMDSWKAAVDDCYKNSSLKPYDIEIINDIGIELGKSDVAGQNNMFLRIFKRLEECTLDAVHEKNTKGKMYKSMGITIGAVIVIILI